MSKDLLVVTARIDMLPNPPKGLDRVKKTATCNFCDAKVWVNKLNIQQVEDNKQNPVLICVPCYGDNAHLRAGFTGMDTE